MSKSCRPSGTVSCGGIGNAIRNRQLERVSGVERGCRIFGASRFRISNLGFHPAGGFPGWKPGKVMSICYVQMCGQPVRYQGKHAEF